MYYRFVLKELPLVKNYYTVTRNTVWEIAEPEHLLILVKEGRCNIRLEHRTYSLVEGDIFYIPANTTYARIPDGDSMCTMSYIHFTLSSPAEELRAEALAIEIADKKQELDYQLINGERELTYPDCVYMQNLNRDYEKESLNTLLRGINLFSAERQLMCRLSSAASLCAILVNLSQRTVERIITDDQIQNLALIPPKLRKAISYIMHHMSNPITLEELAEECCVSKQQMIRYFKKAFGTTPVQYIIDCKIAHAKKMLLHYPQFSIKEIAIELGFENQHYFTRIFTQKTGESPMQFRKRSDVLEVQFL
jgi:AraC-like DNA-binding protein